jgi:hypothetical protein
MCPACITTAALIAAGATSTGGLTALVVHPVREFVNRFGRKLHSVLVSHGVKKLRAKTGAKSIDLTTQTKGEQYGSSENRIAS